MKEREKMVRMVVGEDIMLDHVMEFNGKALTLKFYWRWMLD